MAVVAIVGGTGAEGFGLALRWARAGVRVQIGSRDRQRAFDAALRLRDTIPKAHVDGLENAEAVAHADIVVLTVPFPAQIPTIKTIRGALRPGAIVVDATVAAGAFVGDRVAHLLTPWAGSSAQQAAALLPDHELVSAFHNLSAVMLANLDSPVDCDVLMCGDSPEAKNAVGELAMKIEGVKVVDAGGLDNSRLLESAAALLIALNMRYKVKHSGFRITGLPREG